MLYCLGKKTLKWIWISIRIWRSQWVLDKCQPKASTMRRMLLRAVTSFLGDLATYLPKLRSELNICLPNEECKVWYDAGTTPRSPMFTLHYNIDIYSVKSAVEVSNFRCLC